jgi:murein DD-endopeptidase MepM/ murein hydrolase activator NlpD
VVERLQSAAEKVRHFIQGGSRGISRAASRRLISHIAVLAVVGLGIWAAQMGLGRLPDTVAGATSGSAADGSGQPAITPTASHLLTVQDLPAFSQPAAFGGEVIRLADGHTVVPSRPRLTIKKYVVKKGDTLFGIAERFGLKPETILWGNWETLAGDPHFLSPGQELNILPVDGALHTWSAGEGLNGVAEFYKVEVQDIIDWPGNELDPLIDPEDPDIEPGTALVIPGGRREAPSWRNPRITRDNPAAASILGPGYCGSVYDGPIGTGTFVWPTASTYISGFSFNPDYHPAIDIGGAIGMPIYASDTGVVVYSGWNDWGYGYVVVIDHGNGWQTLYAHMSSISAGCGQAVYQGNLIGAMGVSGNSTGPHLHFEMMSDRWGKVNPINFLP